MSKKALVIGSKGNIGKPLTQYLIQKGYKVIESDIAPDFRPGFVVADINNPLDLLPAFDEKPDVVFMLASMVSRVTCEQAASMCVSTNLAGVNNVLQLAKRSKSKVVFFSTSEVYGNLSGEMSEDDKVNPNNRYGLSKLLAEKLVEYEVEHNGLDAVILRPFMMYDEMEDLGDHRSAMIRFATELTKGKSIVVHKGSTRAWLHVSDAVRAIEAAAHVKKFDIINIGNPDIVSIERLAHMICEQVGADKSLIKEEILPKQMTLIKNPSLKKMQEVLGIKDFLSLQEGVERVCKMVKTRLSA